MSGGSLLQEHRNFLVRVSSSVFYGCLWELYGSVVKNHYVVTARICGVVMLLRSFYRRALFLLLEELCQRLLGLFWVRWEQRFLVVDRHLYRRRRCRDVLGGLDWVLFCFYPWCFAFGQELIDSFLRYGLH